MHLTAKEGYAADIYKYLYAGGGSTAATTNPWRVQSR